ncbi:hypothetical protein TPY_3325 [Sulfobacillus acidophilus TPY]|nr:hypothetical protein TPY_3325 [Sulfobacillus acidophilus TPY]
MVLRRSHRKENPFQNWPVVIQGTEEPLPNTVWEAFQRILARDPERGRDREGRHLSSRLER